MSKHRIFVNSNTYHGYPLDEAIDSISKAGFNAIELTATKGWTEHVFPSMSFSELVRIKRKLKESNLEVIAMSGHANLMDQNRLPDFIENMYLAKFFDSQFIVSSIGEAHLEDKEHLGEDELVTNIHSLIPILEETGLTLVLEVHGKDHGSGKIINSIVKKVNHPQVKIAYDTANALFYGDVNLVEDIEASMDNIAYMHLKDKAGERTEWNFPAIGQGDINFDEIFDLFDKHENYVPMSIEIEFTDKGPKDFEEVETAVIDSYNYLKEKNQL